MDVPPRALTHKTHGLTRKLEGYTSPFICLDLPIQSKSMKRGQLVGGLYGVAIGGAFFGESMFSRVSNASKIALCHLMARLRYGNFKLLDAQFVNDHLIQFGIESIDKDDFQKQLEHAINSKASLDLDVPESIILQSLWQDNNVTS
jgi:leucyl/phenylalanyl-tRNA--protein transferase